MEQDFALIDQEAEQHVKSIGISPCPAILISLAREMRSDDPDFGRIARLISGDVGLAAAMLKTVNSPFYGLPTKATSVQQALVLPGMLAEHVLQTYRDEPASREWRKSGALALDCLGLSQADFAKLSGQSRQVLARN